ncbi:WecB/TagA/CpsF family glycosyltransferase [Alsobacter sp. KACC 23698]|uniref:WecB/TagA/CpsF family glycosyltransferase n=1 Tax=Alsobacter sp. KACC 23698 TaxID=3149229 RepID=A0AAU7JIT2_9HYPH
MNAATLPLFGYQPATDDLETLTAEVTQRVRGNEPARLVVTMNVDHVVQLAKRADFRAAYSSAWLVTIDGAPVSAFAKLKGLKGATRVTGADLFAQVFDRLSPGRQRPFFVVSSPEVGEALGKDLVARGFAPGEYAFHIPEFGFERSERATNDLLVAIERFAPTQIFFGVGAPKSEIFVAQHRDRLGSCYVLCVGAGIEYRAGILKRAPVAWQKAGMEWLWRLASDPKRLYRRYLVDSWRFLYLASQDLFSASLRSESASDRISG